MTSIATAEALPFETEDLEQWSSGIGRRRIDTGQFVRRKAFKALEGGKGSDEELAITSEEERAFDIDDTPDGNKGAWTSALLNVLPEDEGGK